jgi:hypothetical protein
LKRQWITFWQCASAVGLVGLAALAVCAGAAPQKQPKRGKGANELTLAGIRPGQDKLEGVEKQLGEHLHARTPDGGPRSWDDPCSGRRLTLEVDGAGVIQSVDVAPGTSHEPCKGQRDDKKDPFWATGQGLRLGDPEERVLEIYGPPNSSGPSVKQGHELELMFYMFDWAGSDVPQVLEVTCDKSAGRVVEIMLAFPSL